MRIEEIHMKIKNFVRYFRPILNWMLEHIYLIVISVTVIIITAMAIICWRVCHIDLSNIGVTLQTVFMKIEQSNIITELLLLIIPAVFACMHVKLKHHPTTSRRLKRVLYNKSYRLYENSQTPKKLKNMIAYFVNLFYFHKKAVIKEQQAAVDGILSSMLTNSEENNRIYWIVGNSYSGKTTTALNLLVDLIAKERYNLLFQKLDGNIVYFDMGKPDGYTKRFIDAYSQGAFSKCLIILDNLHELPEKKCFLIVNKLVIEKNFFALIVLLRKPDDFIGTNASMLNDIINGIGGRYVLNPLSNSTIEASERREYNKFCTKFFPQDMLDNNHIQIHLYTLYLKRDSDFSRMIPEIQAFLDFENTSACSIVSELLVVIVCCLFSGSCNLHFALNCDPHLTEKQLRQTLYALSKIGFLTLYPNSHEDFFFHEKLAKIYFKYTYFHRKDAYLSIFRHIGASKHIFENDIFKFLYKMPICPYEHQKQLFEEIANDTNFLNLYENMAFLFDAKVCVKSDYYKELGILCDRCGKLREAEDLYKKYFDHSHSVDAFYKLVQVNHAMINSPLKDLMIWDDRSDLYNDGLCDYWQIHIDMHAGQFEFRKILELAKRVQEQADTIIAEHPYDGLHFMRRLYFDVWRLYYLEGILNPNQIQSLVAERSSLYNILNANLDEFEAYYYKFAIGMMLGQDVLFALELELNTFEFDDYQYLFINKIGIDRKEEHHSDIIAQKSVEAYQKAINYMCSIGDKTQIFVKYHMYNVKMFLIKNGDYSECDDFYEEYRSFAERENVPEYKAYARLYKIKLTFIKLCSPVNIDPNYVRDEEWYEWKAKLSEVLDQAEKEDTFLNNQYANLRLMLYRNLFAFRFCNLSGQKLRKNLNKMSDIAEKNCYNREQIVLRYIKHQLDGTGLSSIDIRRIVTCYPIVPQ